MGREVRRVPADWQHPKSTRYPGQYKPLYDADFTERAREWMSRAIAWENGTDPDTVEHKAKHPFFWQWDGMPPDPDDYMPEWPESERTHFQMYETTTEGTPISPVMESPEALARWLADNNASAFGGMTASYESWLRVCLGGYAPSAVMVGGIFTSGVEAL